MPLPRQARDYGYQNTYGYQRYPQVNPAQRSNVAPLRPRPQAPSQRPISPQRIERRKKNKTNPFSQLFLMAIMAVLVIYILPYGYDRISKPLIFGPSYPEVKADYGNLLNPTVNYLSNDLFLDTRMLTATKVKKPEMTSLYQTEKMPVIEAKLHNLMLQYKTIDPSVFVWDYDTGKYVDIKATQIYPTASIIKIPVLIQLFKSIEANQLTIYDEMTLTNYYKAEGSGDLQYKATNSKYTMDQLARAMITKSDNSATNMIVSAVGGMPDVNAGIRNWGLKHTYINNWLPDIAGSNYSTARDLATMLYNLDNPGFLNLNSREYIVDYMSHVENNRLIQAGLDPKALFIHKTGDIGKMLGDAGIVFAPNGKKYICVILANRPHNSPMGKDFIQKASRIIYDAMLKGGY